MTSESQVKSVPVTNAKTNFYLVSTEHLTVIGMVYSMIKVYKFTHGIYTSGDGLFPMDPKSALRRYEYKLKKRYCRTQFESELLLIQSCYFME